MDFQIAEKNLQGNIERRTSFFIIKPLNQYRNINAQTSDEIQSLESYENITVVSDDILLLEQKSNIDLFFT